MANGILVFGEIRDGTLKPIHRELIAAAQKLSGAGGGPVNIALVGGAGVDGALDAAKSCGAEKVYVARDAALDAYSSQGYAAALQAIATESDARVVLFGATAMGRDLSARMAARMAASLFSDCTEVSLDGGNLRAMRPVYSGKAYLEVVSSSDIQMASIRPNIFAPAQGGGSADVVEVSAGVDASLIGGRVTSIEASASGRKDLTEAEIIVSGGRSLKSGENFGILEALADALGGSVGASRAAVDAGYVPHSFQVGQTGKVVNPKLYVACGISGAIQHLVGMRTSKVIVSVNKDANAPIFQRSTYGIVGDLFDVVPLLTAEAKALLG